MENTKTLKDKEKRIKFVLTLTLMQFILNLILFVFDRIINNVIKIIKKNDIILLIIFILNIFCSIIFFLLSITSNKIIIITLLILYTIIALIFIIVFFKDFRKKVNITTPKLINLFWFTFSFFYYFVFINLDAFFDIFISLCILSLIYLWISILKINTFFLTTKNSQPSKYDFIFTIFSFFSIYIIKKAKLFTYIKYLNFLNYIILYKHFDTIYYLIFSIYTLSIIINIISYICDNFYDKKNEYYKFKFHLIFITVPLIVLFLFTLVKSIFLICYYDRDLAKSICTILGALAGGGLTLFGVYLTINYQKELKKEEERIKNIPYIKISRKCNNDKYELINRVDLKFQENASKILHLTEFYIKNISNNFIIFEKIMFDDNTEIEFRTKLLIEKNCIIKFNKDIYKAKDKITKINFIFSDSLLNKYVYCIDIINFYLKSDYSFTSINYLPKLIDKKDYKKYGIED